MPRVPAAGTPRQRLSDGPPGGPHRHVGPYWLWHRQQRHDGACYDKTPADRAQPSERVRCVALVRNTDGHDAGQHHTKAGLLPPVQCAGVLRRDRRDRRDQRRSESQKSGQATVSSRGTSKSSDRVYKPVAFLDMVSHELRAPLTSIKGSAATALGLGSVDRHGLHVLCSHAHDAQEGGELVTASCCPDVRRPAPARSAGASTPLVGKTVNHRGQALVGTAVETSDAPRLTAVTVAAPEAVANRVAARRPRRPPRRWLPRTPRPRCRARATRSCPRRALDELHVEDDEGHGMHTADPTTDLEERRRRPVPPGVTRRPPPRGASTAVG